jgi:glycosyltransferase involved in cell wall biosynthesis
MRLGFACAWDSPPEATWSHTPWSLRNALRARTDVVDVSAGIPQLVRLPLKALHARRSGGRWVSLWKHSSLAIRCRERAMLRREDTRQCDVVLQIQDLAVLDTPYLVFQDLSYDILLDEIWENGRKDQFPTLSYDQIMRLRDRQHQVYERAAGVLAMSRWFADHLVRVTGVPADRVHVVHPGASAAWLTHQEEHRAPRPPRTGLGHRLLFVGKDFTRKAGDQAVAALAMLRADIDPDITLTVVGPAVWPLPGEPPNGVRFLGRLPIDQLPAVFDEHDVFVMPSRFEGFGIALVEALASGLPCVARQACAMPEIVRSGDNGELIVSDDPAELAAAVAKVLADNAMFERVAAQADDVRRYYSWRRAADDVLAITARISAN